MSRTLELTQDLISRNSVTPVDAGCQDVMARRLAAIGFEIEPLRYGNVENLWAVRGHSGPVLCLAGHTDVVPTGPLEEWRTDPFVPTIRDGYLYGRGAADMKSGLAAMVTATEDFVAERPDHPGRIAFLITSDEEGPSVDGTKKVVETLAARQQRIDYCLVGEPSSERRIGDTIKVGRRGSLSGRLTVHGVQGHVAYPQLAENPVHMLAPALAELTSRVWDQGNEYFQPTTFQISNLNAGTGAPNVIPGELKARFNLRYSPVQTLDELKETVEGVLRKHGVRYSLEWYVSGEPFYTPPGPLSNAAVESIRELTGEAPKLTTGGGTSDGRFIAPLGAQVVELGVINSTIHKVNECVRVEDIDLLHAMYLGVMRRLLA
ncbi:MAG: succinyl-diaminopimelate desuccinylase [Sinobacteraceae bacterium]|nr:succinyl-diaminopimelate desuccinylase [Nevskiaceae bacterium]MCP5360588.1 succinyl-diaminopimelate desuccinylase [Nevskiaceae bacterium]MCP5467202.1 succinyl-diaminopimelate desuccinylase [Nevskiaceae bacterium]